MIRSQFPQWADLPIARVELEGWDNTTFRLGETMSMRLPSADAYVAQVDKEHRWLPVLADHLPFAIPQPLERGRPGCGYERPWSIYRWLKGQSATTERIPDLRKFAIDVAAFLTALYSIDASGGPPPGAHSFYRGGSLSTYDDETRAAINSLAGEIDTDEAIRLWERALSSEWRGNPVWVHGDMAPSNLLVTEGRLGAVIDFGCSAVGDPACDTVIAWTFFSGPSRDAFRSHLPLDPHTWARGRGWALWKALITHWAPSREADAQRFGWRQSAMSIIDDLLADPGDTHRS